MILNPSIKDLKGLSKDNFERLIFLLTEAEVTHSGGRFTDVTGSGHINSPDAGIDTSVNTTAKNFNSEFIPNPKTGIQVKHTKVSSSGIKTEMCPKGKFRDSIRNLADQSGSYIIVSIDELNEHGRDSRVKKMQEILNEQYSENSLALKFYDLSIVHQWLRQHPSVMIWVNSIVGKDNYGWKGFDNWSRPIPESPFVTGESILVETPSDPNNYLPIEEGINAIRKFIMSSGRAIRIVGLSGVGKTRFVQALFEEDVGENALDRTNVIYNDVGSSPVYSVAPMIDQLLANNQSLVVVLDNCPSSVHQEISAQILNKESDIKLITIEYDIRRDDSYNTDIIRMKNSENDIAIEVIKRNFPKFSHSEALKIAKFATGNLRISIALADQVKDFSGIITELTDEELFDRLFYQRHKKDPQFKTCAEVLSLVYSYSIENPTDPNSELSALGELVELSGNKLFRFSQQLHDRHIVQERNQWRAVLPTPIANRLATDALKNIPPESILDNFSKPDNNRLLVSLSRRLGFLHDNQFAQAIVNEWFSSGGILNNISTYSDHHFKMLQNLVPIYPDLILDTIENFLSNLNLEEIKSINTEFYSTTYFLSEYFSIFPEYFERCVKILLKLYFEEVVRRDFSNLPHLLSSLFQPKYSESAEIVSSKKEIIESLIHNKDTECQNLGLYLLNSTLQYRKTWMFDSTLIGTRLNTIDLRTTDKTPDDTYNEFIQLATDICNGPDEQIGDTCRRVFAKNLPDLLWALTDLSFLVTSVFAINDQRKWLEGWKFLRGRSWKPQDSATDHQKLVFNQYCTLEKELRPTDLIDQIEYTVLDPDFHHRYFRNDLDNEETIWPGDTSQRCNLEIERLGKRFSRELRDVTSLGKNLFVRHQNGILEFFGKGLAKGAEDKTLTWNKLVKLIHTIDHEEPNPDVLIGYLEQLDQTNPKLVRQFLDDAVEDDILVKFIVKLHPINSFVNSDFSRCMKGLEHPKVNVDHYGELLYFPDYDIMNDNRKKLLIEKLLKTEEGDSTVITIVSSYTHQFEKLSKNTIEYLLEYGLIACINIINQDFKVWKEFDVVIAKVIEAIFSNKEFQSKKFDWLDALFFAIRQKKLYHFPPLRLVRETVTVLTEDFFDYLFDDKYLKQDERERLIELDNSGKSILANVDSKLLIQWCNTQNNKKVWDTIASGIQVIEEDEKQSYQLTAVAKEFLIKSPNPKQVLIRYIEFIKLRARYGKYSTDSDSQLLAFNELLKCADPEITRLAKSVIKSAEKYIKEQKKTAKRLERVFEQTFE